MEITVDRFGFSVLENGKKIASIQLVQLTKNDPTLSLAFSFVEGVDQKTQMLIKSFCEKQKNLVYRVIASPTEKGHDLSLLYLNGTYRKVAILHYGKLEIIADFLPFTVEIERYVHENIIGNFTVCPC